MRHAMRGVGLGVPLTIVALASFAPGATTQSASSAPAVHMVVPEGEATGYWSRWRGPSGQGIAEGAGYPDTWSDRENVLWKRSVPGRGHSSPIIWKDRIFLTTTFDDGRTAVLSFRRSDGSPLWQAFGPEPTREYTHQKNSRASATPTTDGERVYAWFGDGGLLAVDFDGRVV